MNLANKITLARLFLIPVFLIFLTPLASELTSPETATIVATIVFLIAAATDKLDGYVARKYNQVTNLGKLLDPLVDKLLIMAGLLMLVEDNKIAPWMAFIIIGREIVITSFRLLAISRKVVLAADRYGKLKLVAQVIAIALVLLSEQISGFLHLDQIMMVVATALTLYSGVNYLATNRSLLLRLG